MLMPCDLCQNNDKFIDLPGDPSGKIKICGECGFVLVRERRSTAEVAASWDEIYNSGGYDPNWPGVKARLYYVAEWIEQNIGWRGKDVLDIGAGKGQFLKFLFRYNPSSMTAIEPCAKPDDISDDIVWIARPIETAFIPAQYDIIAINWTLENTADALGMLRFAREHLKPGGCVVVATGSRILAPFKKPLRHYIPQDAQYPHDTHCFRWSYSSLEIAAKRVGLRVIQPNDYADRDELIVLLAAGDVYSGPVVCHDPKAVETHFKHWLAMFP